MDLSVKRIVAMAALSCSAAACAGGSLPAAAPGLQLPERASSIAPPLPLIGMTYDRLTGNYLAPVLSLGVKPSVRVVFDTGMRAASYAAAMKKLLPVAYVMGEPVDSSVVKTTPPAAYVGRFVAFQRAFPKVAMWEVGNELNGEWLGGKPYTKAVGLANPPVAKAYAAWKAMRAAGAATALTLYYQPPQTVSRGYDMIPWAQNNFAALSDMADSLTYVFISYYETDNRGIRPTVQQWSQLFTQLHAIFPNAELGFGEVGMDCPVGSHRLKCRRQTLALAESIVQYYYTMTPALPPGTQWALGGFWWYAAEDFEPTSKPLYGYFQNLVRSL
jgi:hypothetical protein